MNYSAGNTQKNKKSLQANRLLIPLAGISAAVTLLCSPAVVLAKQCNATGGLKFLGVSNDQTKSVWLSSTSAGAFNLNAAQGNQLIDSWSKTGSGLHLSISPVVSNGNGGPHKLYTDGNCLLASQNQSGGITFPHYPRPPINIRPPITGITPELPIGVKPPIATLPPATGITPELPMGAKPPIATLPPTTGITPELPMGVKPPIATLPPTTGITPELPMGVKPPIATLPPATGITPQLPQGPNLSSGLTASSDALAARNKITNCAGASGQSSNTVGELDHHYSLNCADASIPAGAAEFDAIPLSEGREFDTATLWNTWVDTRRSGFSDRRFELDMKGDTESLDIGVDRRIGSGGIAGITANFLRSRTTGFNDDYRGDTDGYSVGPYIAHPYFNNWMFDAGLSYGQFENNNRLLVLNGKSTTHQYSATINANGKYSWSGAFLQPGFSIYYTHNTTDAYDLTGSFAGIPLQLKTPKANSNYGVMEPSLEINRTHELDGGALLMPYAEISVRYEFQRPNDGQVMAADLSMVDTKAWNSTARIGIRSLLAGATLIEASAANLSMNQTDLHMWELRLFLSRSF